MNEARIRERLHDAIGDASYPAGLSSRVESRLSEPVNEQHPRAIALVAAVLVLAIVAVLLGPRLLTWRSTVPGGSAPHAACPLPLPSPEDGGMFLLIPPGDFDAAGLSRATALVTPCRLNAANGARKLAFIGAYADPARTVLLFSTNPGQEPCQYPGQYARCFTIPPTISISDGKGLINASSSTGGGLPDEYFFSLDAGPRPGADGIANLTVTVPGFSPNGPADGSQPSPGEWVFSLALKVQPSVKIGAVPSQFDLGSWKLKTEVAEVTPSVIHVQTVISGASVADVGSATVVLLDSSGSRVNPVVSTAAVTVPKQQLNSTNDKITRVNYQWLRPAAGGTYQLQFSGGGGARTININVDPPDPNAKVPCLKPATCAIGAGPGFKPTDIPVTPESLTLDGFLNTTITSGRNQCGIGGGGSGTMIIFGAYFQVDGVWYSLAIRSDPNLRQYSGPGTYTAIAWLYGPTQRLYAGTVSLTVTADHYPGPYRGSVQGTLDRVGTATQQPHLSVSGTWTCTATAP
jgi:hypothetical protein